MPNGDASEMLFPSVIIFFSFSVSVSLSVSVSESLSIPTNLSFSELSTTSSPSPPPPPFLFSGLPFLQAVAKAIASEERWDPSGEVRVSEFDPANALIGDSGRYELHMRAGRVGLILKSGYEFEDIRWKRVESGVDLMVAAMGSPVTVGGLELEGPLELRIDGGENDGFLLHLAALNITDRNLRRVLVGDGITLKLEGAQEVLISHLYNIALPQNGSLVSHYKEKSQFWPFGHASCTALPSVCVIGSASLHAWRTHNPKGSIGTNFRSHDMVELLPDKCFDDMNFLHKPSSMIQSLISRLVLMEKLLGSILGKRIFHNRSISISKIKFISSVLVKFRLELERDITENDTRWKEVEAWRTKPKVERQWFEVVAKVEGKRLKPVAIKKLRIPLIAFHSTAWSNLMSNISLTELLSFVVPPEALTLDVRW